MLVERRPGHLFPPALMRVVLGELPAAVRDLGWLPRVGIELIRDRVVDIDPERRLATEGCEVRADVLVVALGAERTMAGVPGLVEAAHEFYSLRGAARLRAALAGFPGGRVAVLVAGEPYSCPAASYEMALLLAQRFRRRRLEAEVAVYAPEPHPLPAAGPAAGAALAELMAARGIRLRCGVRAVRVEGGRLALSDGSRAGFDLLIAVPLQGEAVARMLADVARGRPPRAGFDGRAFCLLETGRGRAIPGGGDFFARPAPRLILGRPGRQWHLAKVLFERTWLGWAEGCQPASPALEAGLALVEALLRRLA